MWLMYRPNWSRWSFLCMCYYSYVKKSLLRTESFCKFLAIPWKRHCVRLKHSLFINWMAWKVGHLYIHWINVFLWINVCFFDLLHLDVLIGIWVCFLHFLFMTCAFFVDGKNQAAVIFLSQHSIPLEQQTMIPLFDENTDEVNIYQNNSVERISVVMVSIRHCLGCNKSGT